jgi:hypothetical protein
VTENLGETSVILEADSELMTSSDATKVSNRFRRARLLNQKYGLESRPGEDSEATILLEGRQDQSSLMLDTSAVRRL